MIRSFMSTSSGFFLFHEQPLSVQLVAVLWPVFYLFLSLLIFLFCLLQPVTLSAAPHPSLSSLSSCPHTALSLFGSSFSLSAPHQPCLALPGSWLWLCLLSAYSFSNLCFRSAILADYYQKIFKIMGFWVWQYIYYDFSSKSIMFSHESVKLASPLTKKKVDFPFPCLFYFGTLSLSLSPWSHAVIQFDMSCKG